MGRKNIFVIGLNEYNRGELESIEGAGQYNFIPLFHTDELMKREIKPDLESLIRRAKQQIDKFDRSVDGIIGFYDFPVTLLTFYLCNEYGLKAPTLESGIQCEHKFWSRKQQEQVIPDHIPEFMAVDPFDPSDFDSIKLPKPFWLKPVKSFASQLGFKIGSRDEYEKALEEIRKEIHFFADPFNHLLSKIDLPEEIREVDGYHCLAEELMEGDQCTVSGYVHDGQVTVYDLIDSVNYEDTSSFFYYLLPSKLPAPVQERMKEIAVKVMEQTGFDNSPFNIEFFYDRENDRIGLLEINPRMSQSHADLYAKVKGSSNHEILVKIITGQQPDFEDKEGEFKTAGKFQYRVFVEDGMVSSIPGEEELRKIREEYPEAVIDLEAMENKRLSEHPLQDPYSHRLASIYLGAGSEEELLEKYHRIVGMMNIRIT